MVNSTGRHSKDVQEEVYLIRGMVIRHQLARLGLSLTRKETYFEGAKLQAALLHAALFECDSLHKNAQNQLLETGFC